VDRSLSFLHVGWVPGQRPERAIIGRSHSGDFVPSGRSDLPDPEILARLLPVGTLGGGQPPHPSGFNYARSREIFDVHIRSVWASSDATR
jgi:hypothetical protein